MKSECRNCELTIQKTLGGPPVRCKACDKLLPALSIRLWDLPFVHHQTLSYTPHCSKTLLPFDAWKLDITISNYRFEFWYNLQLLLCGIEYLTMQLYDVETSFPAEKRSSSMSKEITRHLREQIYERYINQVAFVTKWKKLFIEFDKQYNPEFYAWTVV